MSLWADLKKRKFVQWALAYLGGAWLLLQVLDVTAEPWGLSGGFVRGCQIVLVVGFLVALILAWYHGEHGRQRVSGPELLMIGGLFALTAAVLSVVGSDGEVAVSAAGSNTGESGLNGPDGAPGVVLRDRPAIAVLPFTNMSGEPENEYFSQGIHDDILTQLSKITAFDVIARTSVMQYAGTEKTIPDIGRELSVETVVEGGVQRAGNGVRINVQLIEAASNTHIWAETYDRELTAENIFAIQTEIAQEIARSLRATLTPEEGSRISQAATGSLSAYDFYLRGREAYGLYQAEANDEAIRLFREALELDPEYARAWAGLGDAFSQRVGRFGFPLSWADSALSASERATEIAPDLPDAYKALGLAQGTLGDANSSLESYLRAIELDPSHLAAVNNIGAAYFERGDFAEQHLWRMRSFRLAPNAPGRRTEVAWSYWDLEEYDLAERWALEAVELEVEEMEALTVLSAVASPRGDFVRGMEIAQRILEVWPDFRYNHQTAAGAALFARDFEQARVAAAEAARLESLAALGPNHHWHYTLTTLGFSLLATGESERGLEVLAEAQEQVEAVMELVDSWRPVWDMASIHAVRGEVDEALEWAERAYASNGYRFPRFIEIDPMMDNLRGDPRFQALVNRMEVDVEDTRRRIEQEEVAARVR